MGKSKVKLGVGRPSDYTNDLVEKICTDIGNGMSLRSVLRQEGMPEMQTVWRWLREKPEFSERYRIATEERTETHNEMLLEMGDDAVELAQDVDPKAAGAVVAAIKIKSDNFKWAMSKMKPKKYGEKMDVTSDGEALKGNTIIFSEFKKPDATDSK